MHRQRRADMSLYADYIREISTDRIIETPEGFATYRYLSDKIVYIIDIYVKPEFRHKHYATELADCIVKEAQVKGCTEVLGSVHPSSKTADVSLKAQIAYGFKLHSVSNGAIILKKDI